MMMPCPNREYHGLFIELKRRDGGKVSMQQKYYIARLNDNGYLAVVCYGAKEAIKIIEEYLE